MTIAVLHRPFDESFARDSIPALRAAGYTDAIRYAIGAGKAISLAEWNAFLSAGMSVTLVDEGGAQMGLSGYHGGIVRATMANQVLDSLGVPRSPDGAMYYATEDPSRRPGTYDSDVNFFQGVAVIHAQYGGRRFGPYGSGAMIDKVLSLVPAATLGWSVRTWGVSARSTLVQEPNPTMSTLGGSVDQDTALLADWGQWPRPVSIVTPATPPTPAPLTVVSSTTDSKEGPMNTLRVEVPVSKGYGALKTTIPWPTVVSVDKEGSDPDADHFYLTGSVQRQQRDGMLYLTITGAGQGDPDHNNLLGTDAAPAIAAVYVTVSA